MSHRSTHYWLWFVLFGVIAGGLTYLKAHQLDTESLWLLLSGLLGIVFGAKWLNNGNWSRAYDIIIGIIFALAGIFGLLIFGGIHVALPASIYANGALVGLSLGLLPSLIHTWLGLTSLSHGARSK